MSASPSRGGGLGLLHGRRLLRGRRRRLRRGGLCRRDAFEDLRALVLDQAARARRSARGARVAAMQHHGRPEERPPIPGHEAHQVGLDPLGLLFGREAHAPRDAGHVRVDDHARGQLERGVEDDVRRLSRHARDGHHLVHRGGDAAAEAGHEDLAGLLDRAGLLLVEARRLHLLLEHREVGLGVVARGLVGAKEALGDAVDALVGALRGEDRRHEEIERARPVELVARVRVLLSSRSRSTGSETFAMPLHTVTGGRPRSSASPAR